jgi:hypothetical protein
MLVKLREGRAEKPLLKVTKSKHAGLSKKLLSGPMVTLPKQVICEILPRNLCRPQSTVCLYICPQLLLEGKKWLLSWLKSHVSASRWQNKTQNHRRRETRDVDPGFSTVVQGGSAQMAAPGHLWEEGTCTLWGHWALLSPPLWSCYVQSNMLEQCNNTGNIPIRPNCESPLCSRQTRTVWGGLQFWRQTYWVLLSVVLVINQVNLSSYLILLGKSGDYKIIRVIYKNACKRMFITVFQNRELIKKL